MKTCYLVDPWLLDLKPEDGTEVRFKRLTALMKLKELHEKYGMVPVKFLDDKFRESLVNSHSNFQRLEWGEVGKLLINATFSKAPQGKPVEIIGSSFLPILPTHWLSALSEIGCDQSPSNWRRPVIVIPEARTRNWPNYTEKRLELKYKVQGITEELARNLVCIETYNQHTYFEPDLDPWRLGCVGEPKPDGLLSERALTCMRLPRPPQINLKLPLGQLVKELAAISSWRCGTGDSYFYLPPERWNPMNEEKSTWRNATTFSKRRISAGRMKGAYGYRDRDNRIWLWHEAENHWDVQLAGGANYAKVSYNGKIL